MKKTLMIALVIVLGFAGFLLYDWHVKTAVYEDDQRVTLYSWTDEKGVRHYTNTQPPEGARNVEESKGFKYTDRPVVIKLKDKLAAGYKAVKGKLFKKKEKKSDGCKSTDSNFKVVRITSLYNFRTPYLWEEKLTPSA